MAGRISGFRCNPCAERAAAIVKAKAEIKKEEVIVQLPVKTATQESVVEITMNSKNGKITYADDAKVFADDIEKFIRAVMREQQKVIEQETVKPKNQVKLR